MVRNPDRLSRQVRAVTIDLTAPNQRALESAVAGADAVLSGQPGTIHQAIGIAS